jgi:hypothetical protein
MKILVEKHKLKDDWLEYSIYDESYKYKGLKRIKYVFSQKDSSWPINKIVQDFCSYMSKFLVCFEIIPSVGAVYDYEKELAQLFKIANDAQTKSIITRHPSNVMKESNIEHEEHQFLFCMEKINKQSYFINTFNSFFSLSIFFSNTLAWNDLSYSLKQMFIGDIGNDEELETLKNKVDVYALFDDDGEVMYLRFLPKHEHLIEEFINMIINPDYIS